MGHNGIQCILVVLEGALPEAFDPLANLVVNPDQQLVAAGFDDGSVELFVIFCNGGGILTFHSFDKLLEDVLHLQQNFGLAALHHQAGG